MQTLGHVGGPARLSRQSPEGAASWVRLLLGGKLA